MQLIVKVVNQFGPGEAWRPATGVYGFVSIDRRLFTADDLRWEGLERFLFFKLETD